ncbi:MAG TPA: YggS family pyridoxal phosphate-dependent enzyme [Myxococcaceae bacterium]|nr:YggS family pyridoxal phosphate-dependent enzyme [Myxococcaceae bacterium]
MSGVAESLAAIRARIESACRRAGRSPSDVSLLAVSKLQPVALVREAYAAGQRDFGENYAQELRDKAAELSDLAEVRWHAIGPLQSNKAKYVAASAFAFHALDRLDVARELSRRRRGEPLRCFLEINLAGEETKGGVSAADAPKLADAVRTLPNLDLVGVMTLPPASTDAESSRPWFRMLRELAARVGVAELSMGTTFDYEIAVEEGATCVRVGTAIFGERPLKSP